MMQLLCDTRETLPLTFCKTAGVEIVREYLFIGDYGFRHDDGLLDNALISRKSKGDLFSSFSGDNYEREKLKILQAKDGGYKYILAIEAACLDVRAGHTYWKDGEEHEVKKDGLTQVRQIMTISRRYDVEIWWCTDRREMAFRIMEYFLAQNRMNKELKRKRRTV